MMRLVFYFTFMLSAVQISLVFKKTAARVFYHGFCCYLNNLIRHIELHANFVLHMVAISDFQVKIF